jgi:hypothetical protein
LGDLPLQAQALPHDKPAPNWGAEWEKDFQDLDTDAKAAFIQHMWAFLEHHDSGVLPHH